MDTNRIRTLVTPWIAPVSPGRGKSPALALAMGFFLGPIGVLLYLRSLADALLLLCLQTAMHVLLDAPDMFLCIIGGCYALSRVLFDSSRTPPAANASTAPHANSAHHASTGALA